MRNWKITLPTESQSLRIVMLSVAAFFLVLVLLIIPACVEDYVGRIPDFSSRPQKGR